jgi:hypothetical protein
MVVVVILVEPENLPGEAFGERQQESVVRDHVSQAASCLLNQLLLKLENWRAPATPQQNYITLLVIDAL